MNKTHLLSRRLHKGFELVEISSGRLTRVDTLPKDFTLLGLGMCPGVEKFAKRDPKFLDVLRQKRIQVLEENVEKRKKASAPKKKKKASAELEQTLRCLDPETAAQVKKALGLT